ncbi:mechanosensitive ion channel family protein [Sphingomonas sp. SUN019]|uniref:mechanosensitive ion channel family protein n=1 Tax=Sphingomonas sp. SUN019 TaxID=2937788 RepID=UPI00216483EB|nr:mechanosensitive ion channel family protein [Sphingomonas sp. SUN019]UVO51903.1 mechanosensitive ion channel family protein [Sphingomonas sp. SUN019]
MTTNTAAAAKAQAIKTADFQREAQEFVSSSTTWVQGHWLNIAIAAGIGTGIALLLFWLRGFGPRLAKRSKSGKGWPAIFGRAIERTNSFFIVTLSARLVSRFAGAPETVADTIGFLFTVAAVFQAAIWAREIILGAVEHRARSENYSGEALISALGLIRLLVTFVVFAIALIVVLDNLGVNVTGLVAGLGVGGIAIGLAAQGIFADLFAALAIIFDRPFRRGDVVAYDQTSGTVEEIGLKSTRIRGINGEQRIIANKQLLDKEITNNTKRDWRRTKMVIGVAYETAPEVLEAIPQMFQEIVEAADCTFVRSGVFQFGASSIDYELEFDSPHPDFQHAYNGRHHVSIGIVRRFTAEAIVIPYPTQTTYTAAPDGTLVMPYANPNHREHAV